MAGTSALLIGGLAFTTFAAPAPTATTPAGSAGSTGADTTVSIMSGHPYRHGAVPQFGAKHAAAAAAATTTTAAANANLSYGGGSGGIGVTTGPEKVYLVFWGSQWGTQDTNSSGYATFSGDPKGAAPYMQAFFKGIGTGGETWSGVMTQYCQGVAAGTQTCPSGNTQHVGYPTGGALAGVWEDTSAASPASSTQTQLADEATAAAAHFGNTTAASNRDTQYVIYSPTGTNPDGWLTGGFCAWHSATDSSYGTVAYTNMPYVTDRGGNCGQGFLNSPGTLDGFSIVNGHEYAETITDQAPDGGWLDSSGEENGDKCSWIRSGQGAVFNLGLPTGSFAVQSTWGNDFNGGAGGCEDSHVVVTDSGTGSGPGELVSAASNKCLDTYDNTYANGTKEEIWTCNNGSGQNWTLSGGTLTVDGGAYCLDAYDNGTADGTKVDLWSCNGGANQQWSVNADGTITGTQSGKCLDVSGAATADGTQVELWTCNGGQNQQWAW